MRLTILFIFIFFSTVSLAQNISNDQQAQQLLDSLELSNAMGINSHKFTVWINNLEQYYSSNKNEPKLLEIQLYKVNDLNTQYLYQQAFELLNLLKPKIDNTPNISTTTVAIWHYEYANTLNSEGNYNKAIEALEKAAPTFEQEKNWNRLADSYYYLIYNMYYSPNYGFDQMAPYLKKLTGEILPKLPKKYTVNAASYSLAGAVYYAKGMYKKALTIFQKSLELEYQYEIPDTMAIAALHNNMAIMYEYLGDYNMAKLNYIEAAELHKTSGNVYGLIDTYAGIANMFYNNGKKAKAEPRYLAALELTQKRPITDKTPITQAIKIYKLVTEYYLRYNYPDKAIQYIQQHIPYIHKSADGAPAKITYDALGKAYLQKKDYSKSIAYYQQSLLAAKANGSQNKTQLSDSYLKLANVYASQNQYQQQIVYLDSVIWALLPLDDKEVSLPKILEIDAKSTAYDAFKGKGQSFINLKLWQKAYQSLSTAILLANELKHQYKSQSSKSLASVKFKESYELLILTLLKLQEKNQHTDYSKEIFQYIEQSKAGLLNESILKYRNQSKNDWEIPDSLLKKEEELLKKLDWYKGQILLLNKRKNSAEKQRLSEERLKTVKELEQYEQMLSNNYPSYKKWEKDLDKGHTIEEIQATLDENTLVIEYYKYLDQLLVFYITKDSTNIVSRPIGNGKFKQLITELRESLTNITAITQNPKEVYQWFTKSAHQLYKDYVDHPLLATHKNLVIIPDYQLFYVPFSVLLTQEAPEQINYKGLNYLLKEYTIHYEYSSALMLHNQMHANQPSQKILGLAPLYGQQKQKYNSLSTPVRAVRSPTEVNLHNQLIELTGTKKELEILEKQFDGDFWVDNNAAEHPFKENCSQYSILHLAMHGIVDHYNPGNSALALTENLDSLEDNLLYVYEVNYLDLRNTDLVVLSACETGYGEYQNGEGVLSVGRSFMQAGVPSLLMTLWELSDQSSVLIIEQFYQNLKNGLSKDDALRQAKLHYLDKAKGVASHPFFWAAFVPIGNNSPLVPNSGWSIWLWLVVGLGGLVLTYVVVKKILMARQKAEV
ncbi:MAG: CHAT domain-containing protein [Aureispira sp.]|nr:CHAT domain-containing protein [Aureispira sp.]